MGFGTTDYGGAYSRALKSAYAQVMPNSQCRQTYKDLSNFEMCTTTYGHDRNDTCQGIISKFSIQESNSRKYDDSSILNMI